jgi:hypothetical protein
MLEHGRRRRTNTMKMMAGCALGLVLAGGCAPGDELTPTPAPVPAQASAYVVAPACGPAKVGSLRELLPDDKIIGALEVDVAHLQRGKLFPEVEKVLAAQGAEVLDAMNQCGVPLAKVEGLMAGFSESNDVVFGIRAKGLGEAKTLDCFAGKLEKATGKAPWSRVSSACETTLVIPDGDTKGFVVGRDIVVFASKSLESAVERRVAGKDRSALDGRLSWVRTEVDMTDTAWMAANVPASAGGGLGPALAGLARVGVSIDATRGLGLRMGAGFPSAAEAKTAAAELETQLISAKAMLPMLGLPSSVGDTIEVDAKGNLVRLGMFLTAKDLETLRKAVEGTAGGGESSSPPPRPGM